MVLSRRGRQPGANVQRIEELSTQRLVSPSHSGQCGCAVGPYAVSRQRIVASGDGVNVGVYYGIGLHFILNPAELGKIENGGKLGCPRAPTQIRPIESLHHREESGATAAREFSTERCNQRVRPSNIVNEAGSGTTM
jgi:hypothetical protein